MLELKTLNIWPDLQNNLNPVIKFCWRCHVKKLWPHNLYFKNTFILIWPREADFTYIIRIRIIIMNATLKDSKKVKAIRKYMLKCNKYLDLFEVSYNCTKFHVCRIFYRYHGGREGGGSGSFWLPSSVSSPKKTYSE